MTIVRRLLHWVFEHPAHRHQFQLHVEKDDQGNVKPYWKCMFVLCDQEEEIDEW